MEKVSDEQYPLRKASVAGRRHYDPADARKLTTPAGWFRGIIGLSVDRRLGPVSRCCHMEELLEGNSHFLRVLGRSSKPTTARVSLAASSAIRFLARDHLPAPIAKLGRI
jgi:hypothetical protein